MGTCLLLRRITLGNVQYLEYDEAVALVIDTINRLISMTDSLNQVNCTDYIALFAEKFGS